MGELSETQLEDGLNRQIPQLGATTRSRIVEASAYHAEVGHPVVRLLVCDDKQFRLVTEELDCAGFTNVTGYAALDQPIAKPEAHNGQLPMVLRHPEIPLHNNPAELGAHARVRIGAPTRCTHCRI
jgi:hypothetical protein